MHIDLQSPARKFAFALLCLLLAGFHLTWATRAFLADRFAAFQDVRLLRRAIAADPLNPRYQHLLGRYLFVQEQDLPGAMASYKRALAMDPYQARYWMDLAEVYQVLGDSGNETVAVERAVQDDPRTPSVAWEAGSLLLIADQREAALRQFQTTLMEGEQIHQALEMSWSAVPDVKRIEAILPPNSSTWLDFIGILTERKETAAAESAWRDLISRQTAFDAKRALFYVDYLLAQREVGAAWQAWKQLAGADSSLQSYSEPGNLVVNGKFEQDPLNAGFDWRYSSVPGVATALEAGEAHNSVRSLAVSFEDAAISQAGVSQVVAVDPNTPYRFSAYVKAQDLASANGPCLGIYDSEDHRLLFVTDETLGTLPWHQLQGKFTTGPRTKAITVELIRTSGTTHINGKFWLDDVDLARE